MTPFQLYQQQLIENGYQIDAQQEIVIRALDDLYQSLHQKGLKVWLKNRSQPIKGLYLWGGVGIGKTWLMDIFYESLGSFPKTRMHFHAFMKLIHKELKQLQGRKNPLTLIAKHFSKHIKILCFDEFCVTDITDAMILAGLLEEFFAQGIVMVMTSNAAPEELYKQGIQRECFLPAVNLILQYTKVIHLNTAVDYRYRLLENAGVYYCPITAENEMRFVQYFDALANKHWVRDQMIHIEGRDILTRGVTHGLVWFDFQVLCNIPRSQLDYLDIARSYHTIFLSNISPIGKRESDKALYLINLIDICYDRRVKMVFLAAVSIDELYPEGRLSFEFARTRSRLIQMQSKEYLLLAHTH